MTQATVTENREKNGIEIRFKERPHYSILDDLKANDWRWSRFSKCWYHKDTPGARKYAQRFTPGTPEKAETDQGGQMLDAANEQSQDLWAAMNL